VVQNIRRATRRVPGSRHLRFAAILQIPFGHPDQALTEYETALKLSPNRLNGLYNAGRAAEAAGNKTKAGRYYAALLKSAGQGAGHTA
jgi:tetratricopeptide (TPR) repeat protein